MRWVRLFNMGNLTGKRLACVFVLLTLIFANAWCEEGLFFYDDKGKRDPFIPLIGKDSRFLFEEAVESVEGIYLEGVILDPAGESLVIINSEIVKCGETIGGFELKEIREGGEKGRGRWLLCYGFSVSSVYSILQP